MLLIMLLSIKVDLSLIYTFFVCNQKYKLNENSFLFYFFFISFVSHAAKNDKYFDYFWSIILKNTEKLQGFVGNYSLLH